MHGEVEEASNPKVPETHRDSRLGVYRVSRRDSQAPLDSIILHRQKPLPSQLRVPALRGLS